MKDLTSRLSRLSAELTELEDELKRLAPATGRQPLQLCDRQLLAQVKNAVDRIRHLLWPYVEASAGAESIDETLQRYRMQRVTEMLHDLRERVAEPEVAAMPEAKSFFASIQEVATTVVERHLERGVAAAKKNPAAEKIDPDLKLLLN